MSRLKIRIRVQDEKDLATAHELVGQYSDVEMEASSGPPGEGFSGQIEPITAVVIGAGAALIAKFVADWWERLRGGLVIDLRDNAEDQIYRDRDMPYGYVAIFPADGGSVQLETKDAPKDALHQLLESVISGTFKSLTDITTAATEALEEDDVQAQES
jgi:hypothetical protein